MNARLPAMVFLLLWTVASARAHRLDEFLQAATIAVQRDHVTVQLRLTPGVAVARTVLAELDPDGDGVVSETEQRAYAEGVRDDLSLTVDGAPLTLRSGSQWFPPADEIRDGTGEILLGFDADVPSGGSDRRLVFENRHQKGIAAYLVNCLVPDDPGLRVNAQNRSFDQSFYQLDYTQVTVGKGNSSPVAIPVPPRDMGLAGSLFAADFCRGVRLGLAGDDRLLFAGVLVLASVAFWTLVKAISVFTSRSN